MVMAEVRDAVIGIVPEEKWSSWWTTARKNPQIVTSGTGAKATYAFAGLESDAETAIRRDFDRADVKTKLELARKHSGRSQELADAFSSALAAEAARLARTDASMAWQILTTLESLPGKYDVADRCRPRCSAARWPRARSPASTTSRCARRRWPSCARTIPTGRRSTARSFFLDQEPRILTSIMTALEESGQTEIRDRLIDETLRYPRRHPHAFYWYVKRLNDDESHGRPRELRAALPDPRRAHAR